MSPATTTTTTTTTMTTATRGSERQRRRDVRLQTTGLLLLVLCCVNPAQLLPVLQGVSAATTASGESLAGVPIMGIDLGTTYSVVALYDGGRVQVLPNSLGNRITPSFVSFPSDGGARHIGDAAKNIASLNPANTVFSVKRLIGREFDTPEVKADAKLVPYKIVNKSGKPYVQIEANGESKAYAPEEISAMVLTEMKKTADAFYGKPINHAVITVPAYFNDAQRQATKDAATIAGIVPVRIINEPTAAALAYGVDQSTSNGKEKNVLVFDLGGGTFDVSILTLDEGVFEVLATTGDTHLGGDDFDARVMEHFVKVCATKYGGDIRNDQRALAKLRREAEKAKRALSTLHETKVEVEGLCGGRDFSETLTRAKFEELNADLFKRVLAPLQSVMKDAKLKKTEIDEVLLVGGSTRIPKVQQILRDYFNGKELNRGVNPDEAVAVGAAIQGTILNGLNERIAILDVASLSIGIETVGGVMTRIIERQTTIPAMKKQVFSTYQDDQTAVMIQVFQGERSFTRDNVLLGKFELTGIRKAPRGVPQIEVTFEIDTDGVLAVSAKDVERGHTERVQIDQRKNGLSKKEIDEMLRDAERNFESDQKAAAAVDKRNKLEAYAYRLKAQASETRDADGGSGRGLADKLDADEKQTITTAADAAIEWLEANANADADDVAKQHSELEATCGPIIKRVYEKHGGAPSAADDDDLPTHDEL